MSVVAPNGSGPTADLPRRLERMEGRMASGHHSRRRGAESLAWSAESNRQAKRACAAPRRLTAALPARSVGRRLPLEQNGPRNLSRDLGGHRCRDAAEILRRIEFDHIGADDRTIDGVNQREHLPHR